VPDAPVVSVALGFAGAAGASLSVFCLPVTDVGELAKTLNVTRQTIYRHLGPNGELRPDGERLLKLETRTDRGRANGHDGATRHG